MLIDYLSTFGRVAAALCFALQVATPAFGETITGPATKVVDGDTLWVAGVKIRLDGVDAPEMDTRAGQRARLGLYEIVDGRQLVCHLGDSSYDRRVGVCYLATGPQEGYDIGALLIADGLALDCPRYSGGRYAALETPGARAEISLSGYCLPR
jgi:endonuclease YncB( thermonuclease family)